MPTVGNFRITPNTGEIGFLEEASTVAAATTTTTAAPASLQVRVTGNNLGGGLGLFTGSNGEKLIVLDFKSLVAGSGINFATDAKTITINSTGGGGGSIGNGVNLGNGQHVFKGLNEGGDGFEFRSLRSTDSKLTVTSNANEVQFALGGLGTAAEANTGTSAGEVPLLDANGKIPQDMLPLNLGTAASRNVGTAPGNLVELDANSKIPLPLLDLAGLNLGNAATRNVGINAGQVPVVNSLGKLDASLLPPLTVGAVFIVADLSERDALTGQNAGDIAIITGSSETYVWDGTAWQQILTPASVISVNGKSGVVTLDATDLAGFHPVATSGDYNALSNKPTLPTLHAVATSGNYNDLSNRPNIPNFATVATTGSYNDLINRPTLHVVATSGNYNDLSNRPALGEVNTYSSLGVAADGEEIKGTKTGVDLPFKRLRATAPITITSAANNLTLGLAGTVVQSNVATVFTKQQNVQSVTLTDAASIAWDLSNGNVGIVTLGGNRTLANPTNMVAGGTYCLIVKQDATGSRQLTYGTAYKWPDATAPTLSTAANSTNILSFICDGTNMYGAAVTNYT